MIHAVIAFCFLCEKWKAYYRNYHVITKAAMKANCCCCSKCHQIPHPTPHCQIPTTEDPFVAFRHQSLQTLQCCCCWSWYRFRLNFELPSPCVVSTASTDLFVGSCWLFVWFDYSFLRHWFHCLLLRTTKMIFPNFCFVLSKKSIFKHL